MHLLHSWYCLGKHLYHCLLEYFVLEQIGDLVVRGLVLEQFRRVCDSAQQPISQKLGFLLLGWIWFLLYWFDIVNFRCVDECQELIGRLVGYFLSNFLFEDLKSIAHSVMSEVVLQQSQLLYEHI